MCNGLLHLGCLDWTPRARKYIQSSQRRVPNKRTRVVRLYTTICFHLSRSFFSRRFVCLVLGLGAVGCSCESHFGIFWYVSIYRLDGTSWSPDINGTSINNCNNTYHVIISYSYEYHTAVWRGLLSTPPSLQFREWKEVFRTPTYTVATKTALSTVTALI